MDVRVKFHENEQIIREGELILSNVYASLLHALQELKSYPVDCVERKFSVSNYPSKGLKDHAIPEKLVFELKHDQCVITEIDIKPIREYLYGIQLEEDCSAKSERFRMGFLKSPTKKFDSKKDSAGDYFIWTHTSPELPINREYQQLAQQFMFPEPVLCIGGFVMIELLGRIQMDEHKEPYYINVHGVNVMGRSLSLAFEAEVQDHSGKFFLSYDASRLSETLSMPPEEIEFSDSDDDMCACACSHRTY